MLVRDNISGEPSGHRDERVRPATPAGLTGVEAL